MILLEGINDIGAESATATELIQADQLIIAQAHAAGLRIYGATLVPFGGSNAQYGGNYGTAAGERQRQKLNHWIRTSGAFDAVFDFDRALRDPTRPEPAAARSTTAVTTCTPATPATGRWPPPSTSASSCGTCGGGLGQPPSISPRGAERSRSSGDHAEP